MFMCSLASINLLPCRNETMNIKEGTMQAEQVHKRVKDGTVLSQRVKDGSVQSKSFRNGNCAS